MAVLVEAVSVVVRLQSIIERFPGAWEGFKGGAPNATLCSDNELVRVGFMSPEDVGSFVKSLEVRGLVHLHGGEAVDVVVVDQLAGPTSRCGHVNLGGNPKKRVAACRLAGASAMQVFTPEGWAFEHSLSQTYGFVPSGSEEK